MQDTNLPNNQAHNPSHVDDYQPPVAAPPSSGQPFSVPAAPQSTASTQTKPSDSFADLDDILADIEEEKNQREKSQDKGYIEDNQSDLQMDDSDANPEGMVNIGNQDHQESVIDDNSVESTQNPLGNQSLETQNIFDLLGVSDGKDDEKEAFLDELQEVIWEDFIETDVDLLLNEDQLKQLKDIEAKGKTREVQEEMLVYLEEILPDLEDIMMDKALELKEDMVLERISGMKEFYSGNQTALDQITQAEGLISENKWADAGNLLNSIK